MAADEYREIERKYDVDWSTALPVAGDLPGVASIGDPVVHELTAVYVDTDDLALAAARVTLRRRTGGHDDGWHLKLPGTGDERLEVRRPPGRSATRVPVQLARLVGVHTRGRALAPVMTLRTRREVHLLHGPDGSVLAEISDDRVTAQAADGAPEQTWREWEAEIVDGEPGLLDVIEAALLDTGAQPAGGPSKLARALGDRVRRPGPGPLPAVPTAGSLLVAYLAEQVDELKQRDPDVRRDAPDAVHRARVALRRIRSALATYRPVLDRTVTDPIRDEARWLGQQLGPARDVEVLRDHLLGRIDDEPPELVMGRVRRTVDVRYRGEYRDAHRRAVEALDDERYFRLLDKLDDLVANPPLTDADRPAHKVLPGLLRHEWRRLRRAVRAAEQAPAADQDALLHEARKATKRVRYAAESAEPVLGGRADRLRSRTKKLQQILGRHHDAVVFQPALRELAVQVQQSGGNAFSFGRLHALEQTRADEQRRRFGDAWAKQARRYPKPWMKR
ncbi:MAG TPA: CYTH and CHAD domain-containing protein [Kribbellaceae bacterium]|nr:CYTH and CHAD domain-containing protein [Kribbellaceae bacterium]